MTWWRRVQGWVKAQRCRAQGHAYQALEPIGSGMRCTRCGRTTSGWTARSFTVPPGPVSISEVKRRARRSVSAFKAHQDNGGMQP